MKVKTKVFTKGRARKTTGKKRDKLLIVRKKFCRFCLDGAKIIDYKDVKKLESFITERGKMTSTRISGNCAKHQRRVVEAIKRARFLSLIPYTR